MCSSRNVRTNTIYHSSVSTSRLSTESIECLVIKLSLEQAPEWHNGPRVRNVISTQWQVRTYVNVNVDSRSYG